MSQQFKKVIDQLVEEVEGLRISIGSLMRGTAFSRQFDEFLISKFLEEKGELAKEDGDGNRGYRVGPSHFGMLRRLVRKLKSSAAVQKLLPESLLVTLVSRYDAFLGRLIRSIVLSQPELLKSSDRTLSLGELLGFNDYETAKEYLIEKEIESVLRRSHAEHFAWLEGKLQMKLRVDLPSWPVFIEVTERRNLLVHCDGVVSHNYLANCKECSVPVNGCVVGQKLGVPPDYFRTACDCILEIAVKLTHVIWRKLAPEDRENADDALHQTCFDLIVHENYTLSNELLCFASHVLKKHATERNRLMFLVNCAQSYKWLGDDKKCYKLLATEDWTAKSPEFRLCVSVLCEKYEEAISTMKQIGSGGGVTAQDYLEWPIFRKARKVKMFQDGFEEVFGKEMRLDESLPRLKASGMKEFLEGMITDSGEQATAKPVQDDNV